MMTKLSKDDSTEVRGETDERRAITTRLGEILQAACDKDFERLAGYHLDSPKFTKFDDFEPLERQDATTAMKSEADGLGAVDNLVMGAEDLKVDVFGTVGVATFVLAYGFDLPSSGGAVASPPAEGEHLDVRARATLVFVREGDQWLIAHEHLSAFKSNP